MDSFLLLNDGTSYLLLVDGVSRLILFTTPAPAVSVTIQVRPRVSLSQRLRLVDLSP